MGYDLEVDTSNTPAGLCSVVKSKPAGMCAAPKLGAASAGGQDEASYLVPITGAQDGMAPIYQDWLQASEFSYIFNTAEGLEANTTYIVVLHFAGPSCSSWIPFCMDCYGHCF